MGRRAKDFGSLLDSRLQLPGAIVQIAQGRPAKDANDVACRFVSFIFLLGDACNSVYDVDDSLTLTIFVYITDGDVLSYQG